MLYPSLSFFLTEGLCVIQNILSFISDPLISLWLFRSFRGFWYLMMQVLAGKKNGSCENPHWAAASASEYPLVCVCGGLEGSC